MYRLITEIVVVVLNKLIVLWHMVFFEERLHILGDRKRGEGKMYHRPISLFNGRTKTFLVINKTSRVQTHVEGTITGAINFTTNASTEQIKLLQCTVAENTTTQSACGD